ncbi:hypothetical protein KJQ75_05860 [Campylobacter lari]|uniref:hypothetical protein n=1 Tax=Campylobacter lari TaxID=201 RepID=UPI0012CA88BA|nr:hypothetical protein [Campylobacter lari]MBT0828358.1 hypothetical protein [Campylobacter lari]
MYVNAKISVDDLELVSLYEIIELFNNLDNDQQEEFFRKVGRISTKKRIKTLFKMLNNNEAVELLNELNSNFKSDKEWQETIKSINGDSK